MFRVRKFPVTKNPSSCIVVAAAMLSLLSSSCGGGSNNSSGSSNLSQAQAQAVSGEVSLALAQALGNTFTPPVARDQQLTLPAIVAEIHPDASSPSCIPTSTGEDCNWPITYSGPCPQGGTISVAGDISGSLNNTGGGSILTLLTITPSGCSVSGLVLNGDPSITVDGQINFSQTAPLFPITLSETGGVSYGPNPSGACKFNVTYTVTSATTCNVTGTACGQSVTGSC